MEALVRMTRTQRNIAFYSILAGLLLLVLLSADTLLAATFRTVNGEVVIEAEQYTRLGGSRGGTWFVNTQQSGFKGSGYIESAKDDPGTLRYSSDIIRAEYEIDFRTTGRYYVHFRTYAEDHTHNGFFATINGSQVDYGDPDAYFIFVKQTEVNPRWYWYTDGGGAEARGFKVSFNITSTGKKTFAVLRRDKGSRVDRIWLTKNQSNPQYAADLNLPNPSNFIVTGGGTLPPPPPPPPAEICNDGVDNDQDGQIDCADSDCSNASNCNTPVIETNCSDGVDNDQDGQIDCADSDCDSASNCNSSVIETNCSDGVDNDQDGFTDCADTNCIGVGTCGSALLSGSFDSGQDGFTYSDDTFRGTNNPAFASGDYVSNGGYSGGALHVKLGGDGVVSDGISGGWSKNFNMNTSGTARVVLSYRLVTQNYDDYECGQVLVAVDGKLVGFGQDDFVDEICGRGDTGWQQVTLDVDNLSAGTHTLTVGGYNNEKTGPLEATEIFIDDIIVTQLDGGSTSPPPTNSFTYADDTFRGTNNGEYASGYPEGDTLKVILGGVPGIVEGISGGWSTGFSMITNGTAQVVFSYRMITQKYDDHECGQVLVAVDGKLVGFGQDDFVDEICGRGDTGWQQVTLDVDNLSAGQHTLTIGGYNNEKTGPLEATEISLQGIQITELNQQDPPSTYDGFSYIDDAFRGTQNPDYASGGVVGGALQVLLGGVDSINITNGMSGGWSKQFSTSSNGNVQITLNYRLTTTKYDDDECGQALVSVDGVLIGTGSQDYLDQICGKGDTGWRNETLDVYLPVGTHTLTVGGYNSKKTAPLEVTEVLFENLNIIP
ncbi:MAG: hypothetical protein ACQ9MH_16660 [Nitrospinales bacterium]